MKKDYFLDSISRAYLFFKSLLKTLKKTYTIMIVPHDGKTVRGLNASLFTIISFSTIAFICVMMVFLSSSISIEKDNRLINLSSNLLAKSEEISMLKTQIHEFAAQSKDLKQNIDNILERSPATIEIGDLSPRMNEYEVLRLFSEDLRLTNESLVELTHLVLNKNMIYEKIPHLWPVKNGAGHVSMYFGLNSNPFSGELYIHSGLDISTYYSGNSIIATGDGRVVEVGYAPKGLGNYISIKHSYGYYSVYGHLEKISVRIGQQVTSGETIGRLGNTGLSTGPHLHYGIVIGTSVVDPINFLDERNKKNDY